jgi:inosine/xanthosine triphosphate pyrophosphatase family protein
MDPIDKNKISHRYRALDKLRKFLLEQDPQVESQ